MERKPLEVGLPDKIEIHQRGMGIEIARRWFGPRFYPLIPFTVAWNYGAYAFFTDGQVMSGPDLWVAFGIGVAFLYGTIAAIFNKTLVTVDRDRLAVRHSPVPWPGNREISASDLKQLYTKEKIQKIGDGGIAVTYEIRALTHRGKSVQLLRGLDESEQARFIEQEIEKHLGIEDTRVWDEVRG